MNRSDILNEIKLRINRVRFDLKAADRAKLNLSKLKRNKVNLKKLKEIKRSIKQLKNRLSITQDSYDFNEWLSKYK